MVTDDGVTRGSSLPRADEANAATREPGGLDFGRCFLPESLARVHELSFLLGHERRVLNQVRAHEYLCLVGLARYVLLPLVLDRLRPHLRRDDDLVGPLVAARSERLELLRSFREEFERGFGSRCDALGPPAAMAEGILARSPVGVALAVLHSECMAQAADGREPSSGGDLDPRFGHLLARHAAEAGERARTAARLVRALACRSTPAAVGAAVDEYVELIGIVDAVLAQQVHLNVQAFVRASGRELTPGERRDLVAGQRRAVRWTYLGSAMMHPELVRALGELPTGAREAVEARAAALRR